MGDVKRVAAYKAKKFNSNMLESQYFGLSSFILQHSLNPLRRAFCHFFKWSSGIVLQAS